MPQFNFTAKLTVDVCTTIEAKTFKEAEQISQHRNVIMGCALDTPGYPEKGNWVLDNTERCDVNDISPVPAASSKNNSKLIGKQVNYLSMEERLCPDCSAKLVCKENGKKRELVCEFCEVTYPVDQNGKVLPIEA